LPLRSNVVSRSSISSDECTSAGSESFTSSYSRYPRSLPTAMSWRTASYFSSSPEAATTLLLLVYRNCPCEFYRTRAVLVGCREIRPDTRIGRHKVLREALKFFGKAVLRCAVCPPLPRVCPAVTF